MIVVTQVVNPIRLLQCRSSFQGHRRTMAPKPAHRADRDVRAAGYVQNRLDIYSTSLRASVNEGTATRPTREEIGVRS